MKLNEAQYALLIDLAYREAGINLKGKHRLIETRLFQRFRQLGLTSVDDYFRRLRSDPAERSSFIDAIATTHTFFFRESGTFKYLRKGSAASIWCAACSSGEEPYSVAMDCLEKGFAPQVLATDLSRNMLDLAQKGVYPPDKIKKMDERMLAKYFRISGEGPLRTVSVREEVRRQVTFKAFNLVTDDMPGRRFDVIFCRNVMIYFDLPTRKKVLDKLHESLKQKGYLIVGGAESLSFLDHPYRFIEPSVYQKV
ncbi:MAG: protein-glutamate O-methyltransferase CheR [Thermodesulfobacteriota bacterium]